MRRQFASSYKGTYSSWGNAYDHGIDLVHPPFWYWAWFAGLGGTLLLKDPLSWLSTPLGLALIAIQIGYWVDRIIEGIFIVQHGFHIHVWRPFNSLLRIYTARRNPNTFIFMIGCILSVFVAEAAVWGFYAVAIWTWCCIVIASAAVDAVVRPICEMLEIEHYIATNMSYIDGMLAPEFATENCYGPEKLTRMKAYLAQNPQLKQNHTNITMYSDSHSDLDILLWADVGIAVDPSKRLKTLANQHGLEVVSWM